MKLKYLSVIAVLGLSACSECLDVPYGYSQEPQRASLAGNRDHQATTPPESTHEPVDHPTEPEKDKEHGGEGHKDKEHKDHDREEHRK